MTLCRVLLLVFLALGMSGCGSGGPHLDVGYRGKLGCSNPPNPMGEGTRNVLRNHPQVADRGKGPGCPGPLGNPARYTDRGACPLTPRLVPERLGASVKSEVA